MTVFRVTSSFSAAQSVNQIQAAAAKLAAAQNELTSGKRITTPSDDPAGTVKAMQLRGELARNTQYSANSDDAQGWLAAADSTYSQVVSAVQQAQTLVVKGLNSGADDATANAAIAAQINGLRSTLLALANTQYDGRPIFGGTTAGSIAYDTAGNYAGDGGTVTRAIAAGATVSVNTNGPAVFGADGSSVFDVLQNIANALSSNPSTLTGSALDQLKSALSTVSAAQAAEGGVTAQVQRAQTTQTTVGTALTTQLSSIEDVDLADMAVKVASANVSYQAALQTTAKVGQLSLLNFLQ